MDRLVERLTQADTLAQQRAEAIRARLGLAVQLLASKGATRVWLFGSMMVGMRPHCYSDVDLVVQGLPSSGLIRTVLEVEDILGARVDFAR